MEAEITGIIMQQAEMKIKKQGASIREETYHRASINEGKNREQAEENIEQAVIEGKMEQA